MNSGAKTCLLCVCVEMERKRGAGGGERTYEPLIFPLCVPDQTDILIRLHASLEV
jgi:hypothetical protein